MGYVRGSHRWPGPRLDGEKGVVFSQHATFIGESVGRSPKKPDDVETAPLLPDVDGNEEAYDVIYFDARPGDLIVHHKNTLHGSRGNTSADMRRRAASIRYIGDDIVWW